MRIKRAYELAGSPLLALFPDEMGGNVLMVVIEWELYNHRPFSSRVVFLFFCLDSDLFGSKLYRDCQRF